MILFPNCKINLGLHITRKRDDGYHDIETVFYPLPLYDILEVVAVTGPSLKQEEISFSHSGITLDTKPEDNLCIRACQLLKKDAAGIPSLRMHLHKSVPVGAGLGGGSADAAFTLRLLNKKFQLQLSDEQLLEYALQLGSDCPFFILNEPCLASGRGEIMEPLSINLTAYKFLLVNPGIQIHTANAFSQVTPSPPVKPVREIVHQPLITWKDELKNDFEEVVIRQFPEIKMLKQQLYAAGALYASMSGSGSTFYAIFEKERAINTAFPSHYFIRELAANL